MDQARSDAQAGRAACDAAKASVQVATDRRLTTGSVRAQPVCSLLTALGIAIGIAAVVLLTAIGEGIHRFAPSSAPT